MSDKYRIDPNFVVPEPTAARYFYCCTEEEYHAGVWHPVLDRWREQGVRQTRVTLVNDEYPHDPYPHGVWFEGWTDEKAQMLPFGEAEGPDKGCSPPLTYDDRAASAMSTGTAKTPKAVEGRSPASATRQGDAPEKSA